MADLSVAFDPTLPDANSDAASDAASKAIVAGSDASDAASAVVAHSAASNLHLPAGTKDYMPQYDGSDWVSRKAGRLVLPGSDTLSTAVKAMSDGDCLVLAPGTYTQTENIPIPAAVTKFSIIGAGMGVTIIDQTADVSGIVMGSTASDANRIQKCVLSGFSMFMSATSSAKTGIYLWGDSSNRTVSPSMIIRDVAIERTDTNKYWGIGINIRNAYGLVIDNCFIRTYHSGATCYGIGVKLESCVTSQIIGGEYFELNKGFILDKAHDDFIYGASKHGCEGISFHSPTVVLTETAFELDELSLNMMFNNITCDFVMDYGIRELAYSASAGYHVINGGWIAADATNCTADSHLVYLQCPGTTVQGLSVTGSATVDINGITITGSTAPVGLAVVDNILRYCETGVYAHKVQDSVFSGNRCSNGQGTYDINLTADADNNTFTGNVSDKNIYITSGATANVLAGNRVLGIDDNGTDTVHGINNKVTRTTWVPASGIKAPGTKPAEWKEWGISGVWEFSDGTDDSLVANLQFPYDMDLTVAPSVSIGVSTNTAVTSETSVWQLEYLYTAPGEDTTAAAQATITVNIDAVATADGLVVGTFPAMAVPGATDVCVHMRVKRLGADPADDLTDTAELHGLCMGYTANKLGLAT